MTGEHSSHEPLDEMVDGRGGVRPHWRPVLAALAEQGERGLAERVSRLGRLVDDEHGSQAGRGAGPALLVEQAGEGGWRCDPLPLPLPAAEFAPLAAGLIQRARLLQAILADLYGAQTLLSDRALPPALVYANPGFLRARRELQLAPDAVNALPLLYCYAADLVRGPDGAWRVLADLVTESGGVGYASDHRRLMSRVMPGAFGLLAVRPLRPFFDLWQDSLHRLAPRAASNPGVAVLTPGNTHPNWFGHMMLARELSCALVECGDLTIRSGHLFLKTLRGLQPIDVLLSRVPGALVDPLDLASSNGQGVPGLLDALRHGRLQMVNDPGAALLEAPALSTFLPSLCERLLGEALRLDSCPLLWLGDPAALDQVRAGPKRWILRSALAPEPGGVAMPSIDLAQVAAAPWRFAASAPVRPSVAPCIGNSGLQPRPVVLRLFLAFDGRKWEAMPGGLARIVPDDGLAGGRSVTGLAKDIWIVDDEQGPIVGPSALPHLALAIRRTNGDLPGRVAETFFWLGRYLERLEAGARLVRIALSRFGGDGRLPRDIAALQILTDNLVDAELIPAESQFGGQVELTADALLASVHQRGMLRDLVTRIGRLADGVRDRLTADMYGAVVQALSDVTADMERTEREPSWRRLDQLARTMSDTIRFTATIAGLAAENMVQGGGRLFLDLGRRIERGYSVARMIASVLDGEARSDRVGALDDRLRLILELCDSSITYRSRYLTVLQAAPVLDLVIADDGNPRGLAFQLDAIRRLLLTVVGMPDSELTGFAADLMHRAQELADQVTSGADQAASVAEIGAPLREISDGIGELSEHIARRYFALLPVHQLLGAGPPNRVGGAA
jgi:uncharacterized circularly permuted ATP-grasp superfamily protein/uncharacterized alpha-E superfamily protein